jgi:YfiH family protein
MTTNEGNQAKFRESGVLARAGFRHAFFTRHGGVSPGPFATLSFSAAVGDSPENVAINLQRAGSALGVDAARIYFLSQVHGRGVVVVTGTEDRLEVLHREGDAVASTSPSLACAVRVADCVPILVGDATSGAAAAIHAGWRGAVRGVVSEAIERLRELAGSSGRLVAAIGPHIGPTAFEVGEDVAAEIAAASPGVDVVDRTRGPKPYVNLERVIRAQLEGLGLSPADIERVPGCTVTDPDLFSYRRDGKRSGRLMAAIVPRAPAP